MYKGANSLRFGGNALGGAINIVTQTGRDAAPLRLRSEGGAFGFWKSYGSGAYDAGPWDAFLALSHTQQDGYRDHAEQDRQRAYGSLARHFDGGASLRLDLNARAQPPGAAGRARLRRASTPIRSEANVGERAPGRAARLRLGRGAVTLSLPVSDAVRIDWQSQTSFQELDHPLAFGVIDNETWNAGSELRLVSEHPLLSLDSRFDAGVQLAYTRQPQTIYENLGGQPRRELRASARPGRQRRALLQRRPRSSATRSRSSAARAPSSRGGACATRCAGESDSVEYWFAAPSLGAIWRAVPGAELYANAGYAFEPGVLFELTAPGNATAGLDLDALDPQRAWQFEIGARGAIGERLSFDIAVFDIELRDEIRNVNVRAVSGRAVHDSRLREHRPLAPLGRGGRARSPARARPRGAVRARGRRRAARADLVHLLALRVRARRRVRQQRPARRAAPLHDRGAALAARLGLWLAPQVEWVAQRWFVDSENRNSAGAYALFNVRAGYDHERSGLSLFVEGRNLADREYVSSVVVDAGDQRYFEPGDGRGVFGGVEWRWH